jgi:DNA-binding response OmpR family regulator
MTRILVVEDDAQTANEINAALGDYGFAVDCASTGREGLLKAAADPYDAIVLDRMLPGGLDGLAVLTALRAAGVDAPVLILSALSAVDERVRGLRAGGDDYMTKPFDFLELTARLDILLRRRAGWGSWRWISSSTRCDLGRSRSISCHVSSACSNI